MTSPARVVLLSEANSKFGGPFLAELLGHPGVQVAGVLTRPAGTLCDYYVGEQDPVDLAEQAARAGLPVLRPRSVNDEEAVRALRSLDPDYLLIANFQQILRKPVLVVPRRAVINFHPSPLPRYAGLAPFFWMARNAEREAGVTALITTPGIDDGPILAQRPVPLTGTESAGEIRDLLFSASRRLLHEVIPRLAAGDLEARPQDLGQRSYYSRPRPQDTLIDWSQNAEGVLRVVRACCPQPGALAAADGTGLRIHQARALPKDAAGDPGAPPGTVCSDARHGLVIACADAWIQALSLSWHPQDAPEGAACAPARHRDLVDELANLLVLRRE